METPTTAFIYHLYCNDNDNKQQPSDLTNIQGQYYGP